MTSSERDPRTSAAHTTAISGSETARYTNVTVISCYTVRSRSGGMGYRSVKTWRQAGKGRLRPVLNRPTFFLEGTRDRFSRQSSNDPAPNQDFSPRVRLMAASGRTTRRGYGWAHQQLRARFAPQVAAGLVSCARCGKLILPWEPWDLGHSDVDRSVYTGPEPESARATSNRRATRYSRVW